MTKQGQNPDLQAPPWCLALFLTGQHYGPSVSDDGGAAVQVLTANIYRVLAMCQELFEMLYMDTHLTFGNP